MGGGRLLRVAENIPPGLSDSRLKNRSGVHQGSGNGFQWRPKGDIEIGAK